MSLLLEDPQTEAIARKLAQVEGISVEQVVRLSLEATAARVGLAPEPSLDEQLTELREWARSHIRRTPGDAASIDGMLGYDERGMW